jgi:16S rRNA (guanine527-N7)-methyltransferase
MNKALKPYLNRAKACYELKELERLGLTPDLDQRELILAYTCLILKWNDVAGLISKNDEDNLFRRHFCDSLQPLLLFGFKNLSEMSVLILLLFLPTLTVRKQLS